VTSRRNQLTITLVAFVLGLLVVVQLRAQTADAGLAALSAQDLTVLVANLNARNDELRSEVATLQGEDASLTSAQSRGDASIDQIKSDLARVRAYAGLDAVEGPGVTITINGPIDGDGLEGLVNELRNIGAEAIAVDGVRLVPGVVIVGDAGGATLDGVPLGDAFDVDAVGSSEQLTGSLTRSGGVIAQLAATQPDVVVTVTPIETIDLPGTTRTLAPSDGHPRL
jgi:uncharacterized protein YlxW (UPF0749 family)